ncbi:MAG: T9SS type A sorting domain-containing protein [Bacteroidia bacterium]|nr:T9SS type A sorting domain-containing protein [Bacteroidia bacterium]
MKIYNLHFTYNNSVPVNSTENSPLQIYPNPFTNKTSIVFDNPHNSSYELIITDITGKKVKEIKEIRSNTIEINRKELRSGIYTVELKGEKLFMGKIIIE